LTRTPRGPNSAAHARVSYSAIAVGGGADEHVRGAHIDRQHRVQVGVGQAGGHGGRVDGGADLVLCMSINPGHSGQAFMPDALPRILALRDALPAGVRIEVDGDAGLGNAALRRPARRRAPLVGEWIHTAVLAIRAQLPLSLLEDTIAQFPSFSEAYGAALRSLPDAQPTCVEHKAHAAMSPEPAGARR
jgi:hypothetical protein